MQSDNIQAAVFCHLHMYCPVPHDKRHLRGSVFISNFPGEDIVENFFQFETLFSSSLKL